MSSREIAGLTIPALPTGDYELDNFIRAYLAGQLDDEGTGLLIEELADNSGMAAVPSHRNDLGDGCPYGSMDPYYTEDGTCPLYCHEADVLVGFDAGDRELPESTDLPPELYEDDGEYKHAVHPEVYP
jgi:hypothetical protein